VDYGHEWRTWQDQANHASAEDLWSNLPLWEASGYDLRLLHTDAQELAPDCVLRYHKGSGRAEWTSLLDGRRAEEWAALQQQVRVNSLHLPDPTCRLFQQPDLGQDQAEPGQGGGDGPQQPLPPLPFPWPEHPASPPPDWPNTPDWWGCSPGPSDFSKYLNSLT